VNQVIRVCNSDGVTVQHSKLPYQSIFAYCRLSKKRKKLKYPNLSSDLQFLEI